MTEALDIEQKKLRATYYNNLSVGLALGGVLIPYLVVAQHLGEIIERVAAASPLTFSEKAQAIIYPFPMFLALWGAKRIRNWADETIASIQIEKIKISNGDTTGD